MVTLLLAACSTSSPTPVTLRPDAGGSIVLRFDPPAQGVSVMPAGTSALLVEGPTGQGEDISEERYDLRPGEYDVAVYWTELGQRVGTLTVPEVGDEEYEFVLNEGNTSPIPVSPTPGIDAGVVAGLGSLRGNPNFDPNSLSQEARRWYERTWAGINRSDKNPDINGLLQKDDSYEFARLIGQYNNSLLLALRATGDLRFLDEVDKVTQQMAGSLADSWCVGGSYQLYSYYDDFVTKPSDGFLNFRRMIQDPSHYCRDVSDLEEGILHGHLALVAYAYHVNRNNPSPAGIDYGARADFWVDYLRNHFEAKWRQRSGRQFPDMAFLNTKFCHSHNQYTMYYLFMGKILHDQGDPDASAYLAYAQEKTDVMFDEMIEVSSSSGTSLVYPFGIPDPSKSPHVDACPTTYSRLMVEAVLHMHMEGFYRWGDDGVMSMIANSISDFVMDSNPTGPFPLNASITGSSRQGGIDPTTYRDRLSLGQANISSFAALGAWQDGNRIEDYTVKMFEAWEADPNRPRAIYVPASMLFAATFK